MMRALVSFLQILRKTIRDEISAIYLQFLAGIALTILLVFSVIQFTFAFRVYAEKIVNGEVFIVLAYGLMAVTCAVLLYSMYSATRLSPPDSQNKQSGLDVEKLTVKFTEGFLNGAADKKPIKESTSNDWIKDFE